MFRLDSSARKIDTVMVMLLYFLFAITAFILILVGIKEYKHTTEVMNDNYEVRTATSYLTEKIRQHDTGYGISTLTIDEENEIEAIALTEVIDSGTYTTYIYYYDGYLRELFVSSDAVYTAESGQPIVEIGNLSINDSTTNSVSLTLTSTKGTKTTMFLSTKSS